MAKENFVYLYGQVISNPTVISTKNGDVSKGSFAIRVIRRRNDYDTNVVAATPLVLTASSEMVEKIAGLRKGDMCEVRGVYTTLEVNKKHYCAHCGETIIRAGNVCVITPIYIAPRERLSKIENEFDRNEEAIRLLKERNEVSNVVKFLGTLCREVDYFEQGRQKSSTYQLAVKRAYRIKEDNPETRVDFPYIRTFGEQAEEDKNALMTNSLVYISGAINTRDIERNIECPKCGCTNVIKELVTEVLPYGVEYLHNCNFPVTEDELNE